MCRVLAAQKAGGVSAQKCVAAALGRGAAAQLRRFSRDNRECEFGDYKDNMDGSS